MLIRERIVDRAAIYTHVRLSIYTALGTYFLFDCLIANSLCIETARSHHVFALYTANSETQLRTRRASGHQNPDEWFASGTRLVAVHGFGDLIPTTTVCGATFRATRRDRRFETAYILTDA